MILNGFSLFLSALITFSNLGFDLDLSLLSGHRQGEHYLGVRDLLNNCSDLQGCRSLMSFKFLEFPFLCSI